MDWIKLLGGIGFGAIITKVLDVIWLQSALKNAEREKWLRDQRMRVFSMLAKELVDIQLNKSREGIESAKAITAEALLLLPNLEVGNDLSHHFDDIATSKSKIEKFINNGSSTIEERAALRKSEQVQLQKQAQNILSDLRALLHE